LTTSTNIKQIKQTFAPSKDTIAAVKSWLIDSGIESDRITLSKSMTWVKFDATIEEAESLLKTEYNVYTHATTGDDFLAVEEYSVPAHIQDKIDFITPTVHFDLAVKSKSKRTDLEGRAVETIKTKRPTPDIHPDPLRVPLSSVQFSLANCNRYITPECLQTLYQLPNGTAGA
jgi:tripeptidyl-peptidase-1